MRRWGVEGKLVKAQSARRSAEATPAGDEPAQSMASEQVLPGFVELSLRRAEHSAGGESAGNFATFLNVWQRRADQRTGSVRLPPRAERVEVVRPPRRLDEHGKRLLIGLEPRRDMRVVLRRPRPFRGLGKLVHKGLGFLRIELEVLLPIGG